MVDNKNPKAEGLPGEEDLQERIAGFNVALQQLLGKYELGLASQAQLLPDGRIGSSPVLVSARKKVVSEATGAVATEEAPKVEGGVVNPDE